MKAKLITLGVKFEGCCPLCGQRTGSRPWELASTALYKREDGRWLAVHPRCAGGSTRTRVAGGVAWATPARVTIDVPEAQ